MKQKNNKVGFWESHLLKSYYNIPQSFIDKAREASVEISSAEIVELYLSIDKKSGFLSVYSDAIKSGVGINFDGAKDIYGIRKNDKIELPSFLTYILRLGRWKSKESTFSRLLSFLVKTKKKEVKFSPDELKQLYSEDRDISSITSALIKAKEDGVELNSTQVKTLFYSKNEPEEMLKFLITSKNEKLNIGINELRTLFINNISLQKLISVKQMLKTANISISFPVLVPLLDKDINIIACIKILKTAKTACEKVLKTHEDIFDKETTHLLANEYVVNGKTAFKKQLSEYILTKNLLEDPALLYENFVKAKEDGFKIHLSLIVDFVKYSYSADIYKVVDAYLIARKNGRYARFKHIAKLAEHEINTKKLIDAQIKSGADE